MMNAFGQAQLVSFNTLALRYQDDAYTLAYYLLGDDAQATGATQAAFERVYRLGNVAQSRFRQEVLRGVLKSCHHRLNQRAMAGDSVGRLLMRLRSDDRTALVLVDVLSLSYAEAAQVLDCSEKELSRRLARARHTLGQVEPRAGPLSES